MLADDSRQSAQRFIHLSGVWECRSHVRLQDAHGASRRIPGCELVSRCAAEVVFRKDLVGIDLTLRMCSLHSPFARDAWPIARPRSQAVEHQNSEFRVGGEVSDPHGLVTQHSFSVPRWVGPATEPDDLRWRPYRRGQLIEIGVGTDKDESLFGGKIPNFTIRSLGKSKLDNMSRARIQIGEADNQLTREVSSNSSFTKRRVCPSARQTHRLPENRPVPAPGSRRGFPFRSCRRRASSAHPTR